MWYWQHCMYCRRTAAEKIVKTQHLLHNSTKIRCVLTELEKHSRPKGISSSSRFLSWPLWCFTACSEYTAENSSIQSGMLGTLYSLNHGLRTPREEIAFTARPKIHSHSQIFRYGQSIFCLPHRPNFSDIFDLCLHWVSVVRDENKHVKIYKGFDNKMPGIRKMPSIVYLKVDFISYFTFQKTVLEL